MKKNWTRFLAAVLASVMIFSDSAFVYAAEVSQPEENVVEETAEEVVEEDITVEEEAVIEDEITAEEEAIVEEETVVEDETLPEEEAVAEEEAAVVLSEEEIVDAVSRIQMELADTTLELDYDVVNETWSDVTSHIILKSDVEGFIIDEDYYADYWANFNSLEIVLYKDGEVIDQFNNTYAFTVSEAGDYTLEATYAHSETEKVTLSADFTVVNGARPYPVNEKIEWTGISSFNKNLTLADIKDDVKELLNDGIEERLSEDESICTEGSVSFKTTAGAAVSDTTKVASGNYMAIYTLNDESGKFYAEAESLLKIKYEKISSAGVEYALAVEEAEAGKLAAAGVALPLDGVNNSPYGSAVNVIPKFNTPWGELTAAELKDYGIVTTVTATVKEGSYLLTIEENGDYLTFTASGSGYGNAVLTLKTSFADEAGNSLGTAITASISKFQVVAGNTSAVKELRAAVKQYGTDQALTAAYTTDGIDTYLFEKSGSSQKYTLDVNALNFEGQEIEPSLTWKTSNSKMATISKDGKTLTILKNAQGVVDITATVKDNAKQSVTLKLMIVDLSVRLDSTKITADSSSAYPILTNIYPNLMAAKLKEGTAEVSIDIIGKSAEIFEMDYYDPETGEFAFSFINENQTNGKYTLKLEIVQKLNEMEFESTTKTIQVTNKKNTPKPTVKVLTKYNKALNGEAAYAEVLVNAKGYVETYGQDVGIRLENGTDLEIKEIYEGDGVNQWYVKIGMKDDVTPTAKSYKDKLIVTYEDYRKEASVSLNISVESKTPVMKVYGNEVYKPLIYTDLGFNTLDVLIDVPDGMAETGAAVTVSDGKLFVGDTEVVLTDKAAKAFEIVSGKYAQYGWTIDSKGNSVLLEGILVVRVKANKSGTLQFKVTDDLYSGTVTTKQLSVATKKATAETVKLYKKNTTSVLKSVTFSKDMVGKESMSVSVEFSDALKKYITQTDGLAYEVKVEAGDKAAEKLLTQDALGITVQGNTVKLTAKEKAFSSTSCNLKISAVVTSQGEEVISSNIKSAVVTIKLVETMNPKVTLTAKGSIKTTDAESVATVKASMKNMPAGYTIASIRFTSAADAKRFVLYDTEYANVNGGAFQIGKNEDSQVPIGKNKIGITYKIRTMGGTTIDIPTTVTVNVVEKVKLKASKSTITLYNSVTGSNYGKIVEFSDLLNNADIKNVEFVTDLKALGISCEQVSEYDNSSFIFYVDEGLNRVKKKTYTVKAKIILENAGTKKGEPVVYTVSFKINLKQ